MTYNNTIAKKIKELRKEKGLTQKELATDICTQAMISNFEKGDVIPTSTTLFLISQKLGVDMNYFFDTTPEQIKQTLSQTKGKKLIRKLIKQKDYKAALYILEKELKEHTNCIKDKQFLMWNFGVCMWYTEKNFDEALQILKNSYNLTQNINSATPKLNSQEVSIFNSIAVLYFETKNYEIALSYYEKCLLSIEDPQFKDYETKIRVFFGISRVATYLEKYTEAILYANQGIELCIENDTLYLLGELYFQRGRIYLLINDLFNSKNCLEKAKLLFQIKKSLNNLKIIEEIEKEYFK